MKKLLFYAVALLSVATALSGCKKDEGGTELPTPVISVKQPKSYPGMSGTYSINYSIENPREGVLPEASSEDSWITGLSVNEKSVSFKLSENSSGKMRGGTIALSYQDAEGASISITQEGITYLNQTATANCYIVTGAGTYVFPPVKGNSDESVGAVASVEVLWESFGTSDAPKKGDLISEVSFKNDMIYFSTNENFKRGNALIAAKDEAGKILWSWHIWMTDQPEDQVYKNDAGTMMDRNLGATSAFPGDIYAIGLLYQWGRKDPFLGSSSLTESIPAKSTLGEWPNSVKKTSSTGTIDYATANPTTFIYSDDDNLTWMDTPMDYWDEIKTIYDPCPPGYRVASNSVWTKNLKNGTYQPGGIFSPWVTDNGLYDAENNCLNFGKAGKGDGKLTDSDNCWYMLSGYINVYGDNVSLKFVGANGAVWGCSYYEYYYGNCLRLSKAAYSTDENYAEIHFGCSVRCQKE